MEERKHSTHKTKISPEDILTPGNLKAQSKVLFTVTHKSVAAKVIKCCLTWKKNLSMLSSWLFLCKNKPVFYVLCDKFTVFAFQGCQSEKVVEKVGITGGSVKSNSCVIDIPYFALTEDANIKLESFKLKPGKGFEYEVNLVVRFFSKLLLWGVDVKLLN